MSLSLFFYLNENYVYFQIFLNIYVYYQIWDQNYKILLKNFKLFRIIPKKKNSLIFLKNFGRAKAPIGPCDGPPLLWLNLQFFAIVIISVGRIFEQACQTKVQTLGGMLGDQNFGHVARSSFDVECSTIGYSFIQTAT